jgi:hypothetical protein
MKTMKHFAAAAIVLSAASVAQADGFRCETLDGSLSVKAYNHTQPSEGTRNVAVLILSDPAISHGRKTIARFTDVNGTVSGTGAHYIANVDLRFTDSSRKGELILGTKLGQLDEVQVDVDFAYGMALESGDVVPGMITLIKRDGDVVHEQLECTRYLKN